MKIKEVSKRYAKALLNITKQKGTHQKTMQELAAICTAFNNDKAIKEYLLMPTISPDQKSAAIKAALSGKGVSDDVVNTLLLLAEKSRLSCLAEMTDAFREALDAEEGVTRGVVKSAKPLTAEAQKDLESKIQKVLNKKIILTYQEDAKLLGGVVAHVGGWTFDDSIETHLNKLNEELNRRAN